MTAAVRTALDALVGELCAEAKADPQDVLELVFVGNPIMHHLLLGIDPVELGGAPFALATDSALELLRPRARPAQRQCRVPGSTSCPASPAMSAPTAPASSCPRRPGSTRRSRCWSMSAPTPRSCWATRTSCSPAPRRPARPSRARRSATASARRPGAIERVRIDRDTLEPRFKVIGCELWSDEPGFAEATAQDRRHRHLRLGHHRGAGRDVPRRA